MLAAMVIHGLLSSAFLAKLSHELSQHSRYALGFSLIAQLTSKHIISLFSFNIKFDQRVQKGTNGGVTIDGLLAAAAAGFSIGLAFVLIGFLTAQCASYVFWRQLLVIPLATAAGLCGSLIDSILGATVQYSGFCSVRKRVVGVDGPTVTRISGMNILDNNGVNVVSILLTTVLTAVACTYIF